MASIPPVQVAFPAAFWGLLILIPIIILYLLKPKPRHLRFPSVMFILNAERSKRLRTFLKKIVRDPLLVIQILVISFLVAAIAQPYFFSQQEENVVENAVIVIDSSASMQSVDVAPSRFEKAGEIAAGIIGKMNPESTVGIVLAENVPIILGKGMDRDAARNALDSAFVADTPTNIGDALLFARNMLPASEAAKNRKIYVLSDFAQGEGADVRLAGKIVSQSNVSVDFIAVSGEGGNLGIVDAAAKRFITDKSRFSLTFTVRNYYPEDREVAAQVLIDDSPLTTLKEKVAADSDKLFIYEGNASDQEHRLQVALNNADSFAVDDKVYAFLPKVRKYKILLVTDETGDQYIRYALQSSRDVELKVAIPPVVPDFNGFDVVFIGEANNDFILPGTFRDLGIYVEAGGHAVFLASSQLPEMKDPELEKLLPVEIESLASLANREGERITALVDHEILSDVVPKGSTTFPSIVVNKYVKCKAKEGSIVIANISDSPAIAYQMRGRGKSIFLGINPAPSWSNFYYSSTFPIFLLQMMEWATRDETSLGVSGFRTGEYLPAVRGAIVKSPSGKSLNSTNLILDETGFYELSRGSSADYIAVNLANEKESNISSRTGVEAFDGSGYFAKKTMVELKNDLFPYVLAAVLALFFVELFYYKRRELL